MTDSSSQIKIEEMRILDSAAFLHPFLQFESSFFSRFMFTLLSISFLVLYLTLIATSFFLYISRFVPDCICVKPKWKHVHTSRMNLSAI